MEEVERRRMPKPRDRVRGIKQMFVDDRCDRHRINIAQIVMHKNKSQTSNANDYLEHY
jgi:hypothetical protein